MYYPEFYFQPNNVEQPLQYEYYTYYTFIDLYLNQRDRMFFKKAELFDDQDLLMTKYSYSSLVTFAKWKNSFSLKQDKDYSDPTLSTEMYSFGIYFTKSKQKFTRQYMKAQQLLAEIGGFMQAMMVIGKFLSQAYNNFSRNLALVNEIFEFKEEKKDDQQNKETSNKNLRNIQDLLSAKKGRAADLSPVKVELMFKENESNKCEIPDKRSMQMRADQQDIDKTSHFNTLQRA